MTFLFGFLIALTAIIVLTVLFIACCAAHMRKVAYRVGLLDHQPSRKTIKGDLWLADREMEEWMAEQRRQGRDV